MFIGYSSDSLQLPYVPKSKEFKSNINSTINKKGPTVLFLRGLCPLLAFIPLQIRLLHDLVLMYLNLQNPHPWKEMWPEINPHHGFQNNTLPPCTSPLCCSIFFKEQHTSLSNILHILCSLFLLLLSISPYWNIIFTFRLFLFCLIYYNTTWNI